MLSIKKSMLVIYTIWVLVAYLILTCGAIYKQWKEHKKESLG